jgi:hypothetical protein
MSVEIVSDTIEPSASTGPLLVATTVKVSVPALRVTLWLTLRLVVIRLKVAVTSLAPVTVVTHTSPSTVQSPAHSALFEPVIGTAVNVTTVL